jgi:DNA-binding NarL/FixJ family response regulator
MMYRNGAIQISKGSTILEDTPRKPIGVLVVEDDPITRKMLCLGVESSSALQLRAAFDSVKPALEWLKTGTVDVLMTDLGLPDGSGLDVIRACAKLHPQCDIMVVTITSDEANVLACIEAGASGYLLKDEENMNVARAVLDLHAGGAPMSPAIARMVLSRVRGKPLGETAQTAPAASQEDVSCLTKRETAILDLIARGNSYSEVAKSLVLSVGTVQTHIKNIYGKLAVHSRGEAVFEAHRRGLLHLERPDTKT